MKSDTPRCDAEKRTDTGAWMNFARQLERELAEAKANNTALREALDKVCGFGRSDMTHGELCDYVTEVAEEALEKTEGKP